MGTLLDVNEYFKDDTLPHGHPWQKNDQKTLVDNRNPNLDRKDSEEPYGYKKDKVINKPGSSKNKK